MARWNVPQLLVTPQSTGRPGDTTSFERRRSNQSTPSPKEQSRRAPCAKACSRTVRAKAVPAHRRQRLLSRHRNTALVRSSFRGQRSPPRAPIRLREFETVLALCRENAWRRLGDTWQGDHCTNIQYNVLASSVHVVFVACPEFGNAMPVAQRTIFWPPQHVGRNCEIERFVFLAMRRTRNLIRCAVLCSGAVS
jgi:hypothetical protein